VPTLDNADPLFALVITPGFYLDPDQDPASGVCKRQAIKIIGSIVYFEVREIKIV